MQSDASELWYKDKLSFFNFNPLKSYTGLFWIFANPSCYTFVTLLFLCFGHFQMTDFTYDLQIILTYFYPFLKLYKMTIHRIV